MTPGEKLQHLRRAKDLTQYDVAELLGIRSSSVGQWEQNATKPRLSFLLRLDEILDDGKGEVLALYGVARPRMTVGFDGEIPPELADLPRQLDAAIHRIAALEKLLFRQIGLDQVDSTHADGEDENHAEQA